jgi:hypothetical protein
MSRNPILRRLGGSDVLERRRSSDFLTRSVRAPDSGANWRRQGVPMTLAAPHGRRNLLRAARPVAMVLPRLSLTLDVCDLGGCRHRRSLAGLLAIGVAYVTNLRTSHAMKQSSDDLQHSVISLGLCLPHARQSTRGSS